MWQEILDTVLPHLPEILGLLIGLMVAWVKSKEWLNNQFLEEFERDVKAAVNTTYQEYVKAIKMSREDGKLTEEEKKEARRRALEHLKETGKAKGKSYAKDHLIPLALDLIEKWVTKKKKGEEE